MLDKKKIRLIIAISVAVILTIVGLAIWSNIASNKNPYGDGIKIQNYANNIKNLSKDYEFKMSLLLHKSVVDNLGKDIEGESVKDAYIRDSSNVQNEAKKGQQYSGSFIVDIASLEQSYKLQYAYSTKAGDPFMSGYPILVSCVNPKDVIYKDFKCKDGSSVESAQPQERAIIQSLPHTTLSYQLRADSSGENLVLRADLRIASMDLSGDEASRRNTVSQYKSEVTSWIRGKGFNPESYTIIYNYNDDGSVRIDEMNESSAH